MLEIPGIRVNEKDNISRTPLHCAAGQGNIEVVQRLLEIPGIRVDEKDSIGCTALDWAEMNHYTKVVSMLLGIKTTGSF